MTPVKPPQRCERHGAAAGWECTACHHPLCPDCAAVRVVPPISIVSCGRCGEAAEPLLRLKSEGSPLTERIPEAFRFPFTFDGLPAWLGIALFLWVTSLAGSLGSLIGWGVAIASFFGVTRSTARGHGHMEMSDFQDPLSSILVPIARLTLVLFPVWVGAFAALRFGLPWLLWLSFGVTALWSPTAFIGAAAGTSLVHMMNPVRVLGATARIGRDFPLYLGATLGVSVLMVVAVFLARLVDKFLVVPVISGLTQQLVLLYAPFVGARIAGHVLALHGPVFGWGEELERYEPMLKDVEPRGALPERERTLPRHLPTAIELEPEPQAPVALQPAETKDRFAAIELSPHADAPPDAAPLDVALLPSLAEQNAGEIRRAITAGKAEVALDGFRSTGLTSAPALTFDELLWLGQTAASRIDYESAELAFREAAQRSAPPEALGRARVMFARLLAERLQRKDDAAKWMQRIVAEQPGTSAAQYAQQWLTTHA